MKTRRIKSSLMVIALVLAVAIAIPFAGAFAILFRAAGLMAIAIVIAGSAVAFTVSPTFRGHLRSLG